MILISFGQVNLYDSLLLDLLDLIHCVVFELVFLPNQFLQKGEMSRYCAMQSLLGYTQDMHSRDFKEKP